MGAIAVRPVWPDKTKGWVVTVLLSLAGWGLAAAGLFPENLAPITHASGALVGLVALNVGMIAVGWAVAGDTRWLGIMADGAGAVGLVGLGLFLNHANAPLVPVGVAERIADYPSAAMLVVLGVFLLVRRRSGGAA